MSSATSHDTSPRIRRRPFLNRWIAGAVLFGCILGFEQTAHSKPPHKALSWSSDFYADHLFTQKPFGAENMSAANRLTKRLQLRLYRSTGFNTLVFSVKMFGSIN